MKQLIDQVPHYTQENRKLPELPLILQERLVSLFMEYNLTPKELEQIKMMLLGYNAIQISAITSQETSDIYKRTKNILKRTNQSSILKLLESVTFDLIEDPNTLEMLKQQFLEEDRTSNSYPNGLAYSLGESLRDIVKEGIEDPETVKQKLFLIKKFALNSNKILIIELLSRGMSEEGIALFCNDSVTKIKWRIRSIRQKTQSKHRNMGFLLTKEFRLTFEEERIEDNIKPLLVLISKFEKLLYNFQSQKIPESTHKSEAIVDLQDILAILRAQLKETK